MNSSQAVAFIVNCFVVLRAVGVSSIVFSAHFLYLNLFWKKEEALLDKTAIINLLNVSCLQSNTSAGD